ncbi:MAG: hypothetical protein ACREAZ_02205 [Nitrososphaera sp.]
MVTSITIEKEWSQWLDFDPANIDTVPESAGVFVTHASMKTLYIGGGPNLRTMLADLVSDACTGKSKRFRYMLTTDFGIEKERLIKEYAEKHGGRLPLCLENSGIAMT